MFDNMTQPINLPANARLILDLIDREGPRTQKMLANELDLTLRALRYALRRMEISGVLVKRANLSDMRSLYYAINEELGDVQSFMLDIGLAEA